MIDAGVSIQSGWGSFLASAKPVPAVCLCPSSARKGTKTVGAAERLLRLGPCAGCAGQAAFRFDCEQSLKPCLLMCTYIPFSISSWDTLLRLIHIESNRCRVYFQGLRMRSLDDNDPVFCASKTDEDHCSNPGSKVGGQHTVSMSGIGASQENDGLIRALHFRLASADAGGRTCHDYYQGQQ